MKRTVVSIITLAMFTTTAFVAPNNTTTTQARDTLCDQSPAYTFSDVSGTHAANVDCITAYGISSGTNPTTFDPHTPLRRDHLATLLVNFLQLATGESYDPPTIHPFTDVGRSVHADNIAIAAAHNLTNGITATQFAPQRHVTRDQFASLLVNTLTAAGHHLPTPTAVSFTDIDGNVHAANVARLAAAGIVSGATPQHFDPATTVTRQQSATLLINAAAELHQADKWDAGPLGDDAPATDPEATVVIAGVALNATTLSDTDTNTAAHDPLIVTGTATADASTVANVQVRIDEGAWINATATSGSFSTETEEFRVVLQDVTNGTRELALRAIDADGLASDIRIFTLDVDKPTPATLESAVTDPAENRIMLTFDQTVSCVDTADSRTAWQFTNDSLHEPVAGQASGAPDTISPLPDSPTMCALNYTTAGIRVSDFGTISYTRPDPDHAVRTDQGQLAPTVNTPVVDTVDPEFLSVSVNTAVDASRVVLAFNKPVRCEDITPTTFLLSIDASDRSSDIQEIGCLAESELVTLEISGDEVEVGHTINVTIFTDLFGASGHGQVTFGADRTGVAT